MNNAQRLRRTAIHEAGHFVVAWKVGVPLHAVTIKPGADYLGAVTRGRSMTESQFYGGLTWERQYLRHCRDIKVALAGGLAVKRGYPGSHWRKGMSDDSERVGDSLLHMYPARDTSDPAFQMQGHLLALLTYETEGVLNRYWHAVEAVATALLERTTLSGKYGKQVILEANQAQGDEMRRKRYPGGIPHGKVVR